MSENLAHLDELPKRDTPQTVEFLKQHVRGSRCDVAAIDPESGRIEAATFVIGSWRPVAKWIDARQGRLNLYYSVNGAAPNAPLDSRLSKEHIGELWAVVVDIDPKPAEDGDDPSENARRERERLKALARRAAFHDKLNPTHIIDTGRGIQFVFELAAPLSATPENVELIEGIGRTLQQRYGGDSVWDVPRIMRLPGTINVMNAVKRKQGYQPALVHICDELSDGGNYTPEEMIAGAPPTAAPPKSKSPNGRRAPRKSTKRPSTKLPAGKTCRMR